MPENRRLRENLVDGGIAWRISKCAPGARFGTTLAAGCGGVRRYVAASCAALRTGIARAARGLITGCTRSVAAHFPPRLSDKPVCCARVSG